MSRGSAPLVDGVRAVALNVPTEAPEADGTLSWTSTTMVLVEASAAGQTGIGWTYGARACVTAVDDVLAGIVDGRDAFDVAGAWMAMVQAVRNDTRPGVMGYATSALDCALWDLKARLLDVSLVDLFGCAHQAVPVYGSGGFTTYDEATTRAQLEGWVLEQSIPRVKIKIGESWGSRVERDLARVRLARAVVGDETALFVDANGAYSAKQAIRVGAGLDAAGVTWFEEPVSSDHLDGLREVRGAVSADVAAGEYAADLFDVARLCGVVDCVQIDVTRIGGYSEWLRAAAVAASHGLQVSGHCAPNLHAPVAASVPNLRHLEWFHDHVRAETLVFDGVLDPVGGAVRPRRDTVGNGLAVRWGDIERYRVNS